MAEFSSDVWKYSLAPNVKYTEMTEDLFPTFIGEITEDSFLRLKSLQK